MKKLNRKKGFTIVELVIVIAVVGVLTAVLVPTFVNLSNKAREAENQTYVKNLNTQMAIREATEGKNKTMYEAMMEAEDIGFNVEKLTPVNGNDVVWDSVANRFAIVDKDGNEVYSDGGIKGTGSQLWKIYAEMPEEEQTYSIYAKEGWKVSEVKNLKVGFDAGKNTGIATVSYIGTSSVSSIRESIEGRTPKMASSQGQEVVIRTNGGTLNVGSSTAVAKGKVWHYGTLSKAVVYTEDNSFHTHGLIADMDLKAGRVVADSNGMIALIKAAAGTKAEKENGGLIFIPEGTVIGEQGINWVQSGEEGDAKQLETLGYNVVAGKTEATAETKAANSYKIGTKDELIQFRKDWNEGKTIAVVPFTLTNDIDVSDYQWAPIGNWEYPFNGTFDGNDHKIIGLTATTGAGDDGVYSTGDSTGYGELFGLFGVVGNGDATIKNLTLTNVNINLPSGKNVGAVIGYAPSNKDFKSPTKGNYYAPNKWTNNSSVGNGSISLSNVTVGSETDNSAIVANAHVGGMIGKTYADGSLIELSDCVNYASITSTVTGFNAGLVATLANNHELKLTNCVNNGNISVPSGKATETGNGGLVGRPVGSLTITLDSCTNNGNITTINQCSGLINLGNGSCSSLTVKNCLNTGNITSLGSTANAIGSHSSLTLTTTNNTGVISASHANMSYGASDNNAALPDGFEKVVINKSASLKSAIIVFEVGGEWTNNTKVVAEYTVTRTGNPGNYTYSASKN